MSFGNNKYFDASLIHVTSTEAKYSVKGNISKGIFLGNDWKMSLNRAAF